MESSPTRPPDGGHNGQRGPAREFRDQARNALIQSRLTPNAISMVGLSAMTVHYSQHVIPPRTILLPEPLPNAAEWETMLAELREGKVELAVPQRGEKRKLVELAEKNARVNLIEDHAFPTVFVASTYADLLKVRASLASYYGLDASVFRMAYLQDSNGYWLVIDPTGFPYAGGLPAQSEPTSTSGSWTLLSSYLIALDATGQTYSRGLLNIL